MALRTIPIRRSGNRPNLFMGGDREMVMFSGLLAFMLIVVAQDTRALVVGIVLWVAALYTLRSLAKEDPTMRFVYFSNRRYKSYYPARSTPFRVNFAGPNEPKESAVEWLLSLFEMRS